MRALLIVTGIIVVLGLAAVAVAVVAIIPVARTSEERPSEHLIPQHVDVRLIDNGTTVEVSWTPVDVDDATLVLQRSSSGNDDGWTEIARFPPDTDTLTYREPWDGTAYLYRFSVFDERGGSGMTAPVGIED